MQPVEKVNKVFIAKLIVLSGILYLGYILEVPQFIKSAKAEAYKRYASPNEVQQPRQIKKLYYHIMPDTEPEEIAI